MSIPPSLLAHYALSATTVADCLKVERADGVVIGFTSLDRALTVDGVDYLPGFSISAISSAEGLAVDNLELTVVPDDDGGTLTATDLLAGRWTGAAFTVFRVNYRSLSDGVEVVKRGNVGDIKHGQGVFVIEFRSLAQPLQMQQGFVTSKTCRDRLGDPRCRIDLTDFTVTGTLSGVASTRLVTDSARTEDDDWFGEGELTATSGDNAGLTRKVKTYAAGAFEFSEAFPFAFTVGDAYTAVAGCRKRHERTAANPAGVSDCIDKFDNVINFFGEPDAAGIDAVTRQEGA